MSQFRYSSDRLRNNFDFAIEIDNFPTSPVTAPKDGYKPTTQAVKIEKF
ncbi:hypothetical protein QUA80_18295 [Microcoleus sp. F4-D5]